MKINKSFALSTGFVLLLTAELKWHDFLFQTVAIIIHTPFHLLALEDKVSRKVTKTRCPLQNDISIISTVGSARVEHTLFSMPFNSDHSWSYIEENRDQGHKRNIQPLRSYGNSIILTPGKGAHPSACFPYSIFQTNSLCDRESLPLLNADSLLHSEWLDHWKPCVTMLHWHPAVCFLKQVIVYSYWS